MIGEPVKSFKIIKDVNGMFWKVFFRNCYNYEKMKLNMQEFNEELVAYVFNPNRLIRFGEKYGFELWDIDDIY